MQKRANVEIREAANKAGVKLWQIAYELGIGDGTFSKKLRRELPTDEQERILKIIDDLAKEVV